VSQACAVFSQVDLEPYGDLQASIRLAWRMFLADKGANSHHSSHH
jgi:hypothetical protein